MEALNGRVAIVTGGARGQGRSHALALAAEGAAVSVWDIAAPIDSVPYPLATLAELSETVALIRDAGATAHQCVVDIRDSGQVAAATKQVLDELGRIDILVANAGVCGYRAFVDMTDEVWNDMIDTNLSGTFKCIRAVAPTMVEQAYGRIIVISSGAGRGGAPNLAHYSSTKWGVIGLTKTVALELAEEGVTANVICPTTVRTPMVENDQNYRLFCPDIENPTLEDALPRFGSLNPMHKPWLEPETVSKAVLYFATDDGSVSGSVLEVSMGASAFRPT